MEHFTIKFIKMHELWKMEVIENNEISWRKKCESRLLHFHTSSCFGTNRTMENKVSDNDFLRRIEENRKKNRGVRSKNEKNHSLSKLGHTSNSVNEVSAFFFVAFGKFGHEATLFAKQAFLFHWSFRFFLHHKVIRSETMVAPTNPARAEKLKFALSIIGWSRGFRVGRGEVWRLKNAWNLLTKVRMMLRNRRFPTWWFCGSQFLDNVKWLGPVNIADRFRRIWKTCCIRRNACLNRNRNRSGWSWWWSGWSAWGPNDRMRSANESASSPVFEIRRTEGGLN